MSIQCSGPKREPRPHEIADGARRIVVSAVEWGVDDERDDDLKQRSFCSFECLADWADEKRLMHEVHAVATDGPTP